jgi:hypothetical protein
MTTQTTMRDEVREVLAREVERLRRRCAQLEVERDAWLELLVRGRRDLEREERAA